ncbi:P-loop containing nucleoside triphosphate hydrolase protein [Sphaerosporella brunnea]|uniref:P-loop containing nucleoside triphosphate hydrolase protein n=1 Tax=Sphaerosporella brunnea TaxID=1250544 RepID=A0A5J5EY59_9PEZI|nr:P-loop containing nucleoside triphosphate hydrolase protein [Sphaerosporella brunnea]
MKAVAQLPRLLAQPGPLIASFCAPSSLGLLYRCAAKTVPPASCGAATVDPTRFRALSTISLRRPRNAFPPSIRSIFSSAILRQATPDRTKPAKQSVENDAESKVEGFERSEKASKAAQVNLSARLTKDGKDSGKAGSGEILRLLSIARPEAKWLGGAFVLLLISSGITMSIPFSIGKILDAATKEESGEMLFGLTIPQFYGALAAVLCCGAAANYGRIILLRLVGERVVARLRSNLFSRTYVQNAEFFDANRVGDLISRLSSDAIIVGKSITQNLSDGLRALVTGTAGIGLMAYVSFKLTSVMAIMFPPIAVLAFFYGRNIRTISRKIQRALGSLTKVAEERLSNVRTSQAFAGEILEVARYNQGVRKIYSLGRKEAFVSATFFSATGLIGNMTILSILYIGGSLVKSGAITIGELSSFLMYTAYAGSSMFGLSSFYSELMKGVGAASRLFELQDRKPTIPATVGTKVTSARGVIKFNDVSFSYPTRPAVSIFDKINFEIQPGTNVAIVGPSGGGKSTISSLLLRFYNPTSGTITINDVDISTLNLKSLRRRIGVVAQEPVLFSGTIAENIAYGKPHASRADIIEAARRANCNFISDFPDGLETNVGARGAMLSGGQKQRIAIARALLKKPDILILDEATSALDAESETSVNEALSKLMESSTTTISIAHRLSTIKRSGHIIVLGNDGKVAETGTFEELSSRNGPFSRLMEWQINGGEAPLPIYHGHPVETEEELYEAEAEEERQRREREEADAATEEEEAMKGKSSSSSA